MDIESLIRTHGEEIVECIDQPDFKGMVYFIASTDRVKIGYTTHLGKRLADLNTGSPVELFVMDYVRANKRVEAALHDELSSQRVVGEWFELSDRTQDLLFAVSDFVETFDDNDNDLDGRDQHVLTEDELRRIIEKPYFWAPPDAVDVPT